MTNQKIPITKITANNNNTDKIFMDFFSIIYPSNNCLSKLNFGLGFYHL